MLVHNIPGLRLYEEGSYSSPRADVWGISDLHLLEEANQVLRAETKPFFAFIQTAGNHEPYTIPDDRRGFQEVKLKSDEVAKGEFASLEAVNGIRFMDHALRVFFETAEKEKYFENTVFFLFGDHGTASTPGLPEMQLKLRRHHVPFVIYAPGFFKEGRVVETVASSVDLLPTAAGLCGIAYTNTTFGRDLLLPPPPGERYAIIDEVKHAGLVSDEFYFSADYKRGGHVLCRYRSETPWEDVSARYPERTAQMARLCRGLHESARYLIQREGR
jgi:phosphoglycerol transferase MdoB-like AlkP superfamily enzyme